MSAENRVHPRAPLVLRVVYQRLNAFIADYTHNISKGGSFIKTTDPLALGTELDFQLTTPGRDDPFRLRGKVVWITKPEEAAEGSPPGMGLSFIWPDEAARVAFESTVEQLIEEALGPAIRKQLEDQRS